LKECPYSHGNPDIKLVAMKQVPLSIRISMSPGCKTNPRHGPSICEK